jgi:hypothetical protein
MELSRIRPESRRPARPRIGKIPGRVAGKPHASCLPPRARASSRVRLSDVERAVPGADAARATFRKATFANAGAGERAVPRPRVFVGCKKERGRGLAKVCPATRSHCALARVAGTCAARGVCNLAPPRNACPIIAAHPPRAPGGPPLGLGIEPFLEGRAGESFGRTRKQRALRERRRAVDDRAPVRRRATDY